jgi:hypothetical protein
MALKRGNHEAAKKITPSSAKNLGFVVGSTGFEPVTPRV